MAKWLYPTSAQTVFAITSGVAGGLASLVLASKFKGQKSVNAGTVIMASALSFGATFLALYLMETSKTEEPA